MIVRTRPYDVAAAEPDPVLDCPVDDVPDAEQLIEAAMRWHFSPETGCAYWLERARTLEFDPREDVRSFADLALFPNVVNELRDVRIEDLIPRGYASRAELYGVYESGGTTGSPKRIVLMQDWLERWSAFCRRDLDARGYPRGLGWLALAPSGPHMVGVWPRELARRTDGTFFTIDFDPRWVKSRVAQGLAEEAGRYVDHLIKQVEFILRTQDVHILVTTPPMLEQLARHDELAELVRDKVRLIQWVGAHMDADTRDLFRTEVFPDVELEGVYASTMVLGGSFERIGLADGDPCTFDPFSPYISFSVVDPETGANVGYGDRGQVVMNHLSKGMLLPNNLERDTAIRVRPPAGQLGDSVADVAPVASFDDAPVVEGVY